MYVSFSVRFCGAEIGETVKTTEGEEVEVSGVTVTDQSSRHETRIQRKDLVG
jgi:hypothetical protein